ncbi:MAG: hypothetical protein O2816_16025 [Planctomycetota bacterium]|nr:hypothetical protein [Planctomycetota bacterium]
MAPLDLAGWPLRRPPIQPGGPSDLRPDGSTFEMGSLLGKSRAIVTTYRAHW